MPVDRERVERLERELAEARTQLLQEDGERYQILKRIIPEEEMQRYLGGLTDRRERVLFGLELPEEPARRRRGAGGERPAKSGGDLTCPICGKAGLTKRGLALHMARIHKGEREEGREASGGAA